MKLFLITPFIFLQLFLGELAFSEKQSSPIGDYSYKVVSFVLDFLSSTKDSRRCNPVGYIGGSHDSSHFEIKDSRFCQVKCLNLESQKERTHSLSLSVAQSSFFSEDNMMRSCKPNERYIPESYSCYDLQASGGGQKQDRNAKGTDKFKCSVSCHNSQSGSFKVTNVDTIRSNKGQVEFSLIKSCRESVNQRVIDSGCLEL